ncbi:Fpg/Nei family DNA glycosylase [Aeromicrobium fastidiosum]|uniref:Fpg/Nei family DNA glycosylase n=1 Tax=Aeromicrobium fastidiosum TaxID=52699 RepID=A0A641ART8_9ACTN|nr:DNA-formamidopyrimidine glycosylase family protein [Aeromicrobium fastidiosum]KAA1380826.1 Fpg/Nei family DNA glycosylase [Aeromicrobium fastidiosum]MBP2390452.1 formamidopyrimidine-DNA glycosylase [Aeromicrobium fastidiosum]
MPELPEVNALVELLDERMAGAVVASVELASFAVLKTFDPPASALQGLEVSGVSRHGKFIDIDVSGIHVIVHLAKAGWLRWSDKLPDTRLKLGASNIAARVRLDRGDGPTVGFDVTEAGTRKGLAMYIVRDPAEVAGIAALGPDPLADGFELRPLLARRMQVKRLLRDQKIIAGVGNAYSDEILHAAKLSPFAIAESLDDDQVERLEAALQDVLREAVDEARGKPADELKDDKRTRMRVHGRAGETCPVCGDTVLEVTYAQSALQYCPTCQTGGKPLKDRTTSKFLK